MKSNLGSAEEGCVKRKGFVGSRLAGNMLAEPAMRLTGYMLCVHAKSTRIVATQQLIRGGSS